MKRSSKHTERNPGRSKGFQGYLRAYNDLKCPFCGSNVYWGTHSCRRCGKDFPDNLVAEVDRRGMMHYIPIEYESIKRERHLSYIIIFTSLMLMFLLALSILGIDAVVSDIKVLYVTSWAFFVSTIISSMLTIYYLAQPDNQIINKQNLLLTLFFMGLTGLTVGFLGLIHVAVSNGREIELLVGAVFVVFAALSLAGARPIWPRLKFLQIFLILFGTVIIAWSLITSFIQSNWITALLSTAGNTAGSIIVLSIGLVTIIAGTYSIFHGTPFYIRLNNCYPTWFAGITLLALFTFIRAALFRPEINLNYFETFVLVSGILLIIIGLHMFVRKNITDNILRAHLARSRRELSIAENDYSRGKYNSALKRYESLVTGSPCLSFGVKNEHPILEVMGINFVPDPKKQSKADNIFGQTEDISEESFDEEKTEVESDVSEENKTDTDKDHTDESTEKEDTLLDGKETEEEKDPDLIHAEATALLKKANFYEKAGMRRKALACLERSIKLDRSRAESWIKLGHILAQLGDSWDKIRSYYEWVIDIKLKMIQEWVEKEPVPSRYSVWLLEEMSVLKSSLLGIGRTLRTLRSASATPEKPVKQTSLKARH